MKNLKSSAGILNRMVAVMKLGFMALSMVSVPVFVKPAFVASYEFVTAVFPRMLEAFSAWLTPTVLYVLVNCLILAILANSNLQRGFNITGSSYEEHNPSAARQKQREEAEGRFMRKNRRKDPAQRIWKRRSQFMIKNRQKDPAQRNWKRRRSAPQQDLRGFEHETFVR